MPRIQLLIISLMLLPVLLMAQNGINNNYDHRNDGAPQQQHAMPVRMGTAGSALTVFSENGEYFYLVINGVAQNSYPEWRVRVEGLPQVVNDVQIIFDDYQTKPINKRISFVSPIDDKPISLTLEIVREQDGDTRLQFFKSNPLEQYYQAEQNEYVMSYGRDGYAPQTQTERQYHPERNEHVVVVDNQTPPPPPAPVGPVAMNDHDFNDALNAIKGNSFDDGKLSTAKSIANSNYLTTDQVIAICNQFSFDNNKLDFAKYAFKRTVDNNSYYKVNSVFTFDTDKQALNDYVNKNR